MALPVAPTAATPAAAKTFFDNVEDTCADHESRLAAVEADDTGDDTAIALVQTNLDAHLADTADAHDASAISIVDAGGDFTATDVEGALAELQADHETDAAALTDHVSDATAAHAASAVSDNPAGRSYATGDDVGENLGLLDAAVGGVAGFAVGHSAATTTVHGIADTSLLLDTGDMVDEDDMASDSAVKVPTQQSVKAYADSNFLLLGSADHFGERLTSGIASLHRTAAVSIQTQVSQLVQYTYFRAPASLTAANITMISGSVASASLTHGYMGVYSINGSGDLTLLSATTDDTALFGSTDTAYTKALVTPSAITSGSWYAVAVLLQGTTMANVLGTTPTTAAGVALNRGPKRAAWQAGQSSLPASVSAATLANTGNSFAYAELTA